MLHAVANDHAIPAGSSLPLPSDALLDKPAAKIGVDKAALGAFDCFTQALVDYSFTPCKPRKPFRF